MARKGKISMICGYPPNCDRCTDGEAKIQIELTEQTRLLCENCMIELVEYGFCWSTAKGKILLIKGF